MIVIDTNVVSEITRDRPDPAVRRWFNARPHQELFLCTPVLAELRYGVERLPLGRRRDILDQAIQKIVTEGFHDRILPVDREAAYEFGRIVAMRYRNGRPIGTMDGLIAAVALVHQAAIATRDVDDFAHLGIEVVDPFSTEGAG
jgi:predicted nucleic acid-binding protein